MKNFIHSVNYKINQFRYRKYKILENVSNSKVILIQENTINKKNLEIDFLIIQRGVKFVNKGSVSGIAIVKGVEFINYGKVEGIIYCSRGTYNARDTSKSYGFISFKKLIVQPGSIIEGEVFSNDDQSFIEIVNTKFGVGKARLATDYLV